ncbi:dihydroorotase [Talaromyces marneffei ATCC 18224]|uniref:dihydroorotase n=1 Tax=Talaromyces marneffei (strain ATCC 18224 / CBS 334.59 / QM 7333) TaxID=441960 RepID=B6QPH4_TALMQ|nr:dihydroorotase, homodimeric type [Talaromyces marneffei ATCC 18224]
MQLKDLTSIELPPAADMHVHLRQDAMMELCTPLVEKGGCDTVFIMPNLTPKIGSVSQAIEYHEKLQRLAPNVKFLMSLYLHNGLTEEEIEKAAKSGVVYGVKFYPAGVTTNSQEGVLDIEQLYPVFAAMEKHDLVLNLHGEMISTPASAVGKQTEPVVTVLNAEPLFIPQLAKLHAAFPKLRIVLEHVSTKQGLDAVRACGPNVAGTITAHHLHITIDDAVSDVFNFCKPVAKTPEDRLALVKAVVDGSGKFFFGSDSAPHPIQSKKGAGATAAGCFTQPYVSQIVIKALEVATEQGWINENELTLEAIEGFLSGFGRKFYKLPAANSTKKIRLEKKGEKIPDIVRSADGAVEIVPWGRGREVRSLTWV